MPVLTKLLDSQRTSSSVNLLNKNILKRKPLTTSTNTTLLNAMKKFRPLTSVPSTSPSSSTSSLLSKRKNPHSSLNRTHHLLVNRRVIKRNRSVSIGPTIMNRKYVQQMLILVVFQRKPSLHIVIMLKCMEMKKCVQIITIHRHLVP